MNFENYFKDLFESFEGYRKIVLIIFLIKNDMNFLRETGFSEHDINRLNLQFKNLLTEQDEEYLDYIKNEAESAIERFLNNKWNNISLFCLKIFDMKDR